MPALQGYGKNPIGRQARLIYFDAPMTQPSSQSLRVPPLAKPERLDKFLIRVLPQTSRAFWRDRPEAVRIDGKAAPKGRMLRGGETIEILAQETEGGGLEPDQSLSVKVLYEDEWLLAVDKPAGSACHPLRPGERGTVANALVARYPELGRFPTKPLEGGLLHRLDNDTSGVLLFCRSEAALKKFRTLNRSERIEKFYLAVAAGAAPPRGSTDVPIAHDPKNKKKMRLPKDEKEAKRLRARPAFTEFRRVKKGSGYSLLMLRIRKGARHQIRVHLAGLGHPIAGDRLYGSGDFPRQLLHARRVEFIHPFTARKIALSSPLPRDFAAALRRFF